MDEDLPSPNSGTQKSSAFKSSLLEFFEAVAVCIIVVLVIYVFVARPHKVSGSSMFPNFHDNDYLITNIVGYRFTSPQRGQVIIFKNPRDLSQYFIKRIIGLPGETVIVQNAHVYINGQLLNEPYLNLAVLTAPGQFLQEGRDVSVPPDNYIVMGDNRSNSSDSREWGFVPKDDIIGQALFRYWPSNEVGLIQPGQY